MKKIALTTMVAGALAVSAFAQGTVQFTASSKLYYSTDGTAATLAKVPNPPALPGDTGYNVALYLAPAGTSLTGFTAATPGTLDSNWKISDNVLHTMAAAGTMVATFTTSGITGGQNYQAILLGWTGNFADWNSAVNGGAKYLAWSGSALSGGAFTWSQGTGAPAGSPPSNPVAIATGASAFNTLAFQPVPEPSTIALAGLGAAAMMIFRRRK